MDAEGKTPPGTPSKIPLLQNRTPSKTPVRLYKEVCLSPQERAEYCIFCGKRQMNSDYRRRLISCGIKTNNYHELQTFLGRNYEMTTEMICKFCYQKISNANKLKKQLITEYYDSHNQLKEKFGRTISKRLVLQSPNKKGSKRSKVHEKENEDPDDLGVAPLSEDTEVAAATVPPAGTVIAPATTPPATSTTPDVYAHLVAHAPVIKVTKLTEHATQTVKRKVKSTDSQTDSDAQVLAEADDVVVRHIF